MDVLRVSNIDRRGKPDAGNLHRDAALRVAYFRPFRIPGFGRARPKIRELDDPEWHRWLVGAAPPVRDEGGEQRAILFGVARVLFALVPDYPCDRIRKERRDLAVEERGRHPWIGAEPVGHPSESLHVRTLVIP